MKQKKYRVQPGKVYKVAFGVNQMCKVSDAANNIGETTQEFLKKAAIERAKLLIGD